jgi:serine phosphatase RsbU (regulator of sigma subunit)
VLGGDFYDAVTGSDGTVHAIVGDVCGHGPDEAALGALLRVSWRALVLAGVPEPRLLPELQRVLLSERHDRSLFTTVATVAVTGRSARVRVAGHPPPVALAPAPHQLQPPVGLPLGIAERSEWTPLEIELAAGWGLLLYTDGLVEGRGPVPDEPLWPEGLVTLLEHERDTPWPHLPARLVERVQQLNGGPLSDDTAVLLLVAERR